MVVVAATDPASDEIEVIRRPMQVMQPIDEEEEEEVVRDR